MNHMIRTVATACLAILLMITTVRAEPPQEEKKAPMDLTKTAVLYQQWSTRPSFPESVPFAYYAVYGLRALGKEVPKETHDKIVAFLKSCQKPDGGFANDPKYAPKSNIIFTYYALQALDLLKEPGAIDQAKVTSYLSGLQTPEGGFKAAGDQKEKPTLAATYYGVRALALLNKLDRVNKEKAAAFIAARKEKGAGYSLLPGNASAPPSTFMAVHTLKDLGMLSDEVSREVTAYLKDSRYGGHETGQKYYSLPTMQDLSYVLRALRELSALNAAADLAKVDGFVQSLYIDENGGFGPQPGYGTTPPSTYYAMVCLVQLGKLTDPLR